MFKQITTCEITIGERVYQLLCQSDSPLGELHDALMQIKGTVVERMIEEHKKEQIAAEAHKACADQGECDDS